MLVAISKRTSSHHKLVLAVGVLAEIAVLVPFALLGRGPFIGSLGALPVGVACCAAFLAGPWIGVAVASAGWTFFFPLVVHWSPFGLVALVLWAVPAALLGYVAQRLKKRERQLALLDAERRYDELRAALADHTQHEVRTPAAVIYGMADVMLRGEFDVSSEQKRKFLALIAESAQKLTEVPERLDDLEPRGALQPLHLLQSRQAS